MSDFVAYVTLQESILLAVSSRKWTAFGSETDSVSDECNSSSAGQYWSLYSDENCAKMSFLCENIGKLLASIRNCMEWRVSEKVANLRNEL